MTAGNTPFFYIITTTYNRPELLLRNILSVQNQTYQSFLHLIINDSEDARSYVNLKENFSKKNIYYKENKENFGKNKTLNDTLSFIKSQNKITDSFIIYLDDDDWLHPEALVNFVEAINKSHAPWIVSNRSLNSGKTLTRNKTKRNFLSYQKDYLLLKRFQGDATHCIEISIATEAHYPDIKKNGEEWIYFSQIDLLTKGFLFIDKPGTLSGGYLVSGVTKSYKHPSFLKLLHQAHKYKILTPFILLYIFLRKTKHCLLLVGNFK